MFLVYMLGCLNTLLSLSTCSTLTTWMFRNMSNHMPFTYNVKMDTFDINSINLPLLPVKFQGTYKF